MNRVNHLPQRARISFPIQIELRSHYSYIDIVRGDNKTAIQDGSFFSVTPQNCISGRDFLKSVQIARIQTERSLKVAQTFLILPLATLIKPLNLKMRGSLGKV